MMLSYSIMRYGIGYLYLVKLLEKQIRYNGALTLQGVYTVLGIDENVFSFVVLDSVTCGCF